MTSHGTHRHIGSARPGRLRLLIVLAAPLTVLVSLTAGAATTTAATSTGARATHSTHAAKAAAGARKADAAVAPRLIWSRTWNPPLSLLSNYRKCCPSQAGFLALPYTYDTLGSQEAIATATFRTNWVDVKALKDGPNIAQQGIFANPAEFKLQIFHSLNPIDHRGTCHIKGATGSVLAFGPKIDIADGKWHTIVCVKNADTSTHTTVTVIVDGVAGKPSVSRTRIGIIIPTGPVDLGGRSSLASSDSLDGYISSLSFSLIG
jgi:hypothetical protein